MQISMMKQQVVGGEDRYINELYNMVDVASMTSFI